MKFQIDKKISQVILNENHLIPIDEKCPVCTSIDRKVIYHLQDNPTIDLMKCNNCFVVSASRIPNKIALDKAYANFYAFSHYGQNIEKVTMDGYRRLSSHIYNNIPNHLLDEKSVSILDFGGGSGAVSIELAYQLIANSKINNIQIDVVDYEASNRHINKNISVCGVKNLLELKAEKKYNIVIASAIMEHVPYPREDFNRLFNSMQKGGIFYARTPYFVPFMKLFSIFGIKAEFIYPIHLHDMGDDFWNRILESLGSYNDLKVKISKPSIAESSFKERFLFTLGVYCFKIPWYLLYFNFLRRKYKLTGGWEVFIEKNKIIS